MKPWQIELGRIESLGGLRRRHTRGLGRRLGRYAALAAGLLSVCVFTAAAQETFAVFVGINDYVEFGDEPGGDLQGAESDAISMRRVLVERWGLAEENTLTLLSLDATKDAIRLAITGWLAERVGPDDLAIFYFAGHGSQVYDLDGDEPDGLDETLAPTDVLQLSSVNDIRDDEFRVWLSSVGTEVVVILDSCHSGTATRGGSEMRTRSLDRPIPPEDGKEPERVRQAYDPESMADGATTILELAAAAPNQSALEGPFGATGAKAAEPRGAFTWFLVEELRQARPDITYEEVLRSVADHLFDEELPQDPQITGVGTRAIFRRPG